MKGSAFPRPYIWSHWFIYLLFQYNAILIGVICCEFWNHKAQAFQLFNIFQVVSNLHPVYCFKFIWAVEWVSAILYIIAVVVQHEATSLCPMSSFFSPNLIIHIPLGEISMWSVGTGASFLENFHFMVGEILLFEMRKAWRFCLTVTGYLWWFIFPIEIIFWCSFPWKFISLEIILSLFLCLNHKVYFPDQNSYCIMKIHSDSSNSQFYSAIFPAFIGFP